MLYYTLLRGAVIALFCRGLLGLKGPRGFTRGARRGPLRVEGVEDTHHPLEAVPEAVVRLVDEEPVPARPEAVAMESGQRP